MSVEPPYPEFDEIMTAIGEAGWRLSEIQASEGAAGNISVYMGWPVEPRRKFPLEETIELPLAAPELAGGSFLVTGSGRRLREIKADPAANLGLSSSIKMAGQRAYTLLRAGSLSGSPASSIRTWPSITIRRSAQRPTFMPSFMPSPCT